MDKSSNHALIGGAQTLILPIEGGSYILKNVFFDQWNLSASVGGYTQGTVSFVAQGMEYTKLDIATAPLIGEYTITDMLRIIRQKIKER